jgi:hypothetical protein
MNRNLAFPLILAVAFLLLLGCLVKLSAKVDELRHGLGGELESQRARLEEVQDRLDVTTDVVLHDAEHLERAGLCDGTMEDVRADALFVRRLNLEAVRLSRP